MLSSRREEAGVRAYHELYVRSETGLGAEVGAHGTPAPAPAARQERVPVS